MKTQNESLCLSKVSSFVVPLLFTWFAFLFATMLGLSGGIDAEGGALTYTFQDWLSASSGSLSLYIYLIVSFLFFYFSFKVVGCISWRWRILAGAGVFLIFCALVWAVSSPVLRYLPEDEYVHEGQMEENLMGEQLQKQMATIATFTASARPPVSDKLNSRKDEEGLFDPQSYFTVFKNLSMEPGYELDYSYYREGYLGFPEIFVQKQGADIEPKANKPEWYSKIHLNGTPESYLEYAALFLFANQFYISEHAAPYSEGTIIATTAEFEELISGPARLSPWALKAACQLDFFPTVEIGEDRVIVSFATVSDEGGLEMKTFVVGKEFPHQIIGLDPQSLIVHDFGTVL